MKVSDGLFLLPTPIASLASDEDVAVIPQSQSSPGDGRVSIEYGYPHECSVSVINGGKFPQMRDANGVFNLLSSAIRAIQSHPIPLYNQDFSEKIGGYPTGSVVIDDNKKFWVSVEDDNEDIPSYESVRWASLEEKLGSNRNYIYFMGQL